MLQFSEAELARMSPEVRAWAIQNGYARGGTPGVGFGMNQGANMPMNNPVRQMTSNLPGGPTTDNLGLQGNPMDDPYVRLERVGGDPKDFVYPRAYAPDTSPKFKMPLTTTPQAESTGFKGYPYSKPNDMSIDAMSSDPNYGQFYSRMRNDYNVANTSLPTGSSGMPSVDLASQSARQQASDQAVADSISGADAGGMSNLQSAGMYYGANVATDALINTHDRKKVDTPFGNKGSMGGIAKGGVKGALLGAQLSGGNPYATAGGAVVGALAGTQGGFDTNTPPSYQVVGVRRRQGGGGLLAPKGMYG